MMLLGGAEGLQKCQGRVGSNQRENQGCEETREADNKDDVEGQAVEEEEEEEEEEENEREVSTERGDQREDGGGRPECAQTRKGEEGLGKDEGGRGGEEERIRGREERAEEIDGGRKEVLVMDGDREELKGGPLRASGSRKEVEKGGGVEEKDLGRVKGGGEKKKNRKQYEAIGKLPNLFEGALAIAAAEKAGFPLDEKKIHPLLRSREAREKLIAISQRTRESTGLHMEEGPVSLGSEKDGWCALCGVRSGWMMCGRCDGQGVYPSLRGLAGIVKIRGSGGGGEDKVPTACGRA
ncbi:hypothetical protein CBR_g4875 [Chara braunii]|uniref:Uncharacterized protein n=1 Tax=Chara braunii TaxID=69332 RepID=A0A388KJ42_CHABU|nr:hypothetical protein CBR_g4875 [Chara braunii]|eukprot:GBG70047.1 hypothetical protein CBR_g4875 [Chara braunii]